MQNTDDFDDSRVNHSIVEHMHRISDRRLAAFVAAVANVKVANAGKQLGAIEAERPSGSAATRRIAAARHAR
jgi:hypothetical protein